MNQIGLVEIAGIIVVLALIAWQVVFFQVVRPRIMARIGRWLSVDVHESHDAWDAGLFDTQEGAPLRKTAGVAAADLVVILVGLVGVVGAVTIPLFLLAESGLPYRWEGQLTGTAVRIGEIVVPPMTDRKTTARVTVRNEARDAMRACRLDVAGYTARNGYLTGASNYFDLGPAATETVDLALGVLTRVPGTHTFRVDLECGMRLKDGAGATVEVPALGAYNRPSVPAPQRKPKREEVDVTVAGLLIAAVAAFAVPVMFAGQTRDYAKFNVCEFIPGDAIARAVGGKLTQSRPTFDKNWSRCAYYVTDANGKPNGYVVWIQPAEDFEELKKHIEQPITPVSGLGDAAYVFQDDDRRFKLNVLKRGDLMFQATADTRESARKVADTVLAIVSKK